MRKTVAVTAKSPSLKLKSTTGVGNPTKKNQLKSYKSNKMLGFLLGFLKTPTPNSDRQCWVFLLDFCWVFRKSCLIFVGFLSHLLDFCWVFCSSVGFLLGPDLFLISFLSVFLFIFNMKIFYRGSI